MPKFIQQLGMLAAVSASLLLTPLAQAGAAPQAKATARPLLMAHYMPWYQAKPFSQTWGWHWTMNHFDPDRVVDGRPEAASQYRPLIGLYDSGDPDALRCQALLMKMAGIDGVIFDWYGTDDYYDYAAVNRNTERMIPILQQAGLRFALCYETQTVPTEIKGGVFPETEAVAHGRRLMQWLGEHFFSSPAYLTLDGRPVFLTFGDPYYKNDQWEQVLSAVQPRPLYFTEADRQGLTVPIGAFDWPHPSGRTEQALAEQDKFYAHAADWPLFIAAAFPRFDDIYAQAGLHPSWGHIDDRAGRTYEDTLTKALQSRAPIVQLVTWNDWGEGTQIEPSVETGCRDLETTQRLSRKYLNTHSPYTAADLRLPIEWYRLTKQHAGDPRASAKLAAFFPLVIAGHKARARALLAGFAPGPP